ncbi:MAG: DUF86 domain-containing protein [Candidatus Omnitrophica bacterium]|nr:DUF86 domain-containing protein [Candidatus Omnitrophota bacterium]
MLETDKNIELLKNYFTKRPDVVMAFLFGSRSQRKERESSDWDIAVYLKPNTAQLEWEELHREYPEEENIWNDCIDILKRDDIDLIILNRAASNIADAAMRGIPLVIKDRRIYLELMLIVSREAEDYRVFADEFFAISQRSASLTALDKNILQKTIIFLKQELESYSVFKKMTQKEYQNDPNLRRNSERWVENIINASIDISKIILSSEKKLIPDTYADALRQGIWLLGLPENFLGHFERWVKLRNILAHEYLDIKWKRMEDFIANGDPYIRDFVEAAEKFLSRQ